MQLSRRKGSAKRKGFFTVGKEIIQKETPLGLYKGLGAVITGIVPKMAIRFSSFEFYKGLAKKDPETGKIAASAVFLCKPSPPFFRHADFPAMNTPLTSPR
jgi:solute carrier family 25 citrate transporter 1